MISEMKNFATVHCSSFRQYAQNYEKCFMGKIILGIIQTSKWSITGWVHSVEYGNSDFWSDTPLIPIIDLIYSLLLSNISDSSSPQLCFPLHQIFHCDHYPSRATVKTFESSFVPFAIPSVAPFPYIQIFPLFQELFKRVSSKNVQVNSTLTIYGSNCPPSLSETFALYTTTYQTPISVEVKVNLERGNLSNRHIWQAIKKCAL